MLLDHSETRLFAPGETILEACSAFFRSSSAFFRSSSASLPSSLPFPSPFGSTTTGVKPKYLFVISRRFLDARGTTDDITTPILEPVLRPLWAAYACLKKGRDARSPLAIESLERKIVIDEQGQVVSITPRASLEAHRLIEEMMIQANVSAAETSRVMSSSPCSGSGGISFAGFTTATGKGSRRSMSSTVMRRSPCSVIWTVSPGRLMRSCTRAATPTRPTNFCSSSGSSDFLLQHVAQTRSDLTGLGLEPMIAPPSDPPVPGMYAITTGTPADPVGQGAPREHRRDAAERRR